jgi:uncharacterized protein YdeI (YjbR/CyaY-like superfamily)
MNETLTIHAKHQEDFRVWLRTNHNKEKRVHILLDKRHTGKPAPTHRELMDEAICFGWIDTTVKRIDEEQYQRAFVRRNKNSRWSNATLSYAEILIKKRKMTKAGLKAYEEGKKKPTIDHNLPKKPATPKDLSTALEKNKKAKQFFATLAPSYKRMFIYWIISAKREETRKKRIKVIVTKCKERKKQ